MQKLKVLIADDNPRMASMIQNILMDDDEIQVVGTAEDGVETLGMIEETEPDLLLLDLIMPKLDGLGCDVATDTDRIIREYKNQYLVDDHAHKNELRMQVDETRTLIIDADFRRITGTVKYVGKGTESFYAYVVGADGKEYSITESIYSKTESAIEVIQKGKKISFIPGEGNKKLFATEVKIDV